MKLSIRLTRMGIAVAVLVWLALCAASWFNSSRLANQEALEAWTYAKNWLASPTPRVPRNWQQWQLDDQPAEAQPHQASPMLGPLLSSLLPPASLKLNQDGHRLALTLDNSPLQASLQWQWLAYLVLLVVGINIALWQGRWLRRQLAEQSLTLNRHLDSLQEAEELPDTLTLEEFNGTLAAIGEARAKLLRQASEQQKLVRALSLQVLTDPLTGLPNRRAFNDQLTKALEAQLPTGLVLIRATPLKSINDDDGYSAGDDYLKGLAEILKRQHKGKSQIRAFRLSGSDFLVMVPQAELAMLSQLAQHLMAELMSLRTQSHEQMPAYLGAVLVRQGQVGAALAQADNALSLAMAQGQPGWHLDTGQGQHKEMEQRSQQQWREHLQYLLSDQGLTLMAQPVQGINRNQVHYTEILARCYDKDGRLLPTASVMAMAERLGLIQQLDKLVMEKTLKELLGKPLGQSLYAINLNALTVQDPHFVVWLERRLIAHPELARHLVFEVPEAGLVRQIGASQRFIELIHKMACRITIERFGTGLGAIRFFKALKPDFVKVDAALSRAIDQDADGQYYLRILVDIAHRLGVKVLAENVENAEERMTLTELRLDGLQGYYLARPVLFGPSALTMNT
ncbi:EAL domain-containing protein [Gallaecimonas xiamenensis]|uniref:GGDEF/EAL domain-containing protein n=1 Tax=Gallaecimonas xiamenensis 3-C-1 TaxID=745411 RepID=K2J2A9_9GAMM|nr:EAL domain-containing protein [Gallaecimonas xiamenensis]EKE69163.1 GGDEF/EAL domain-containing protein [Gallaecimonas xiamenensis 3-C-1]